MGRFVEGAFDLGVRGEGADEGVGVALARRAGRGPVERRGRREGAVEGRAVRPATRVGLLGETRRESFGGVARPLNERGEGEGGREYSGREE